MSRQHAKTIGVRGKQYAVTGSVKLGGKTFLILDRPLSRRRTKYCVFDHRAGPRGELRAMHVVPRNDAGYQYAHVVRRLTDGNINLPSLVEYHAHGEDIYLILTWMYGVSLAEFLRHASGKQRLWPSAVEAFKLFRGLAHGLRQLHHKKNFVHGDVCPDNLVLCRAPNRLVLIDFGAAWRVEQTRARVEGDGIQRFYASPEQLQQKPFVDFRSDQFSASLVLYQMLTGELPYGGLGGKAGLDEHHAASLAESWIPPSQKSGDRDRLPRWLWSSIDRVAKRGLALDPARRYQNAKEWLREIDSIHLEMLAAGRSASRLGELLDWKGWLPWK